jgi:AbiU2
VDWRNRRLAHRDLDLSLKRNQLALAPATPEQVEALLSALRNVLNRIEKKLCRASTVYDSPSHGDAEALLYVIRDGLQHDRDRCERLKRGELRAEDMEPPEPL